ncbi:cysteine desulfurase sulfur acceptor subunit CsdE [Edwardsiella ictaluri]|uniref:cysteine desulfurase sulfur acceptor subunit CsdE n=1 Tax=Edwardsiella ictaluri TaxID=67780 RepID=UPI0009BF2E91|nr:cysteine desulfurase sulfur acceptor subunit CsdE [Edwardsiella ictaluri]ARD40456.1 cysteine desulfurase sulfur acceptor subunit CsdE [Edwardsiella ictaluri]QPW26006.1 cysteine desulfurase sulfur acceptor subunit CsdE [Edwardsiella ictaluri]
MKAPHPFGRQITAQTLCQRFAGLTQWEDRYRQIIMLARELPPLDDTLRCPQAELAGCENRVWLDGEQLEDGTLHLYGDSEGRIVKGLLAILLTAIEGKTPAQVLESDPLALFGELNIMAQLSASRSSGLQALAQGVAAIARRYADAAR